MRNFRWIKQISCRDLSFLLSVTWDTYCAKVSEVSNSKVITNENALDNDTYNCSVQAFKGESKCKWGVRRSLQSFDYKILRY